MSPIALAGYLLEGYRFRAEVANRGREMPPGSEYRPPSIVWACSRVRARVTFTYERTRKTNRRRGYTRVSAKNQVTIPQDALVRAGLKVGDRLRAEAGRPGELILVREENPVDRFAGALTGVFAPDELDELRREWH